MASRPTRLSLNPDRTVCRCESQKVCYASKDVAMGAAEWMMDRGAVNPGCHIMPYHCDECGYWHVANRRIVWEPRYFRADWNGPLTVAGHSES